MRVLSRFFWRIATEISTAFSLWSGLTWMWPATGAAVMQAVTHYLGGTVLQGILYGLLTANAWVFGILAYRILKPHQNEKKRIIGLLRKRLEVGDSVEEIHVIATVWHGNDPYQGTNENLEWNYKLRRIKIAVENGQITAPDAGPVTQQTRVNINSVISYFENDLFL